MRKPKLTDRAFTVNGKLAHDYDTEQGRFRIHDSARNALLVIELFDDQAFPMAEKLELAAQMVFAKPEQLEQLTPESLLSALDCVLWDFCGIDLLSTRPSTDEAAAWDWEQDAARIKASLLMAYGLDWDECSRKLTFPELCDLLGMLLETDEKTPFSEAVYYRTAKPPKRDRFNGDYVDGWLKRRRYYNLKREPSVEDESRVKNQMSAMIDSLWKAAENG